MVVQRVRRAGLSASRVSLMASSVIIRQAATDLARKASRSIPPLAPSPGSHHGHDFSRVQVHAGARAAVPTFSSRLIQRCAGMPEPCPCHAEDDVRDVPAGSTVDRQYDDGGSVARPVDGHSGPAEHSSGDRLTELVRRSVSDPGRPLDAPSAPIWSRAWAQAWILSACTPARRPTSRLLFYVPGHTPSVRTSSSAVVRTDRRPRPTATCWLTKSSTSCSNAQGAHTAPGQARGSRTPRFRVVVP